MILCQYKPLNDKPNKDLPFLMGLIEAGKLTPSSTRPIHSKKPPTRCGISKPSMFEGRS